MNLLNTILTGCMDVEGVISHHYISLTEQNKKCKVPIGDFPTGCNGSLSAEKDGHTQLTKWSRVREWYIVNTCKVLRHFTTSSAVLQQHTTQRAQKKADIFSRCSRGRSKMRNQVVQNKQHILWWHFNELWLNTFNIQEPHSWPEVGCSKSPSRNKS